MNLSELKALISEGESERLELKRSSGQRAEAAKTVCAMLNGFGGFVLFGATDKGELVGQQVVAKTLEDTAAELRKIEPPAFPDIQTFNLKGGLRPLCLRRPSVSPSWSDHNRDASRRIRAETDRTAACYPALGE